ncbi:MAG: divergent PAP2 family protein [Patescibacteria group bacterium]|jgi:acid phosphatase family membrane protein YuiD|nr:divergent PAP2 family protein [Patescibacteria group bacterium]
MDLAYIIIPIIVGISSQALKLLTDGIKGNFDFKNIMSSYGGMPSSHTAFAVSITTLLGIKLGFDQPIFALALIFTLLIIRDAVAFRGMLGKQAIIFNKLIDKLGKNGKEEIPYFRERMGHSIAEVGGGIIWGIGLTILLNLI